MAPLRHLGKLWKHDGLYIKREDLTDSVYGGNKVRNLEFLLGAAMARNRTRLATIAPLGSNFVAALTAQAKKFNFNVDVSHFVPARSAQIDAHHRFSTSQGARFTIFQGRSGVIPAGLSALGKMFGSEMDGIETEWIAPGGSSLVGALGHVNAGLEMAEQVARGEMPRPDVIVVGVGTRGTIAGLTTAMKMLKWNVRIIGVRCVDAIICHRTNIASFSTNVLDSLGARDKVRGSDIELVDPPSETGYGTSSDETRESSQLFESEEGIQLDQTYTSKVTTILSRFVRSGELNRKKVLYWHTFSPKAMPVN